MKRTTYSVARVNRKAWDEYPISAYSDRAGKVPVLYESGPAGKYGLVSPDTIVKVNV